MKLIVLFLASISLAAVYTITESESNARINPLGSSVLEIASNPTTGYMWYLIPSNSAKLTVQDPVGEYISPAESGLVGAPGKQRFTVTCTELCEEGDILKVVLALQRPWEKAPIDIRKVSVEVTNDQLD